MAQSTDGVVRVFPVESHAPLIDTIELDSGDARTAVYVGHEDGDDDKTVAIVLDAAGHGGLVDERHPEERIRAKQRALLASSLGSHTLDLAHGYRDFLPHHAPEVPRLREDQRLVAVEATLAGTLPLPSIDRQWPVAADHVEIVAFNTAQPYLRAPAYLAAWLLRVPGGNAVRFSPVGFEDKCVIGDAASGSLELPNGLWPPSVPSMGFAANAAGAPLLCVQGPDLSVARGLVAFDAEDRFVGLVVFS